MTIARDLARLRTPVQVENGGTGKTTEFRKGFIDGFRYISVGDNAITVTAGAAYIPSLGRIVEMPTNKAFTGFVALAARSQHHFYLFENAQGVADVEISLTAPQLYYGTAYNKSGDASRRYLFSVLSGTTGFWPMYHEPQRGRMAFLTGAPGVLPFNITSSFQGRTPTLVDVVISNSGVNSLAPRETTTMLHTNVYMVPSTTLYTSPPDQATAMANANWGNTTSIGNASDGALVPFDIRPSRSGGTVGNYYVWTASGAVNMYGIGYTFER